MEFTVGQATYRSGKLDAFKQFHIGRRLAPLQAGLAEAAQGESVGFTPALAGAIAGMSDADCDYILQACLGVVQRQQDSGWANILAAGSKTLMFHDIDVGAMLEIAGHVITENLGGFFGASADQSPSPPTTA